MAAMERGQLNSYGGMQPTYADLYKGQETISLGLDRRRVNTCSVVLSMFVPLAIFMTVFGVLSFEVHFSRPGFCWFFVAAAFLVVALIGGVAWQLRIRRSAGELQSEPLWVAFIFATCLAAWLLALVLGFWNYRAHMMSHYQMVSLNTYTNVDPGSISGTGVMDAGRLSFKAGTVIDTSKAVGFKKVDTYCAAPVTSTNTPLLNYDFWAVGVNCCSGEPGDFHCGEKDGLIQLGGGERVLSDAEIPWFSLAVQQAEAFHHIKVGHAIFFRNTDDPLGLESTQMDRGVKFFILWSLLFFGLQAILVSLNLVVLSRAPMHKA